MTQQNRMDKAAPAVRASSEDLSAEIANAVERQRGDQVRCTRVSGNMYRCNWWAPESTAGYDNPRMGGLMVTTHRVRKSRFLIVTKSPTGLTIEEQAPR
jgi:hypothetical protein